MNRDSIARWHNDIDTTTRLAPQTEIALALAKAEPETRGYPTGSNGGGSSRSADATSAVERAVLQPDHVWALHDSNATDTALVADALRRIAKRNAELHGEAPKPERENTVPACVACAGPALPRPRSHAGEGPFCEADYRSWYRIKESTPTCTLRQWLTVRERHNAA